MKLTGIKCGVFFIISLMLGMVGCARDGNIKEVAYEVIRGANNMHQPGVGENQANELSYREYEQQRREAMHQDEVSDKTGKQPPAWLIEPNR